MPTGEDIVRMIKDRLLELYRQKGNGRGYSAVTNQIHAYESLLNEIMEEAEKHG